MLQYGDIVTVAAEGHRDAGRVGTVIHAKHSLITVAYTDDETAQFYAHDLIKAAD